MEDSSNSKRRRGLGVVTPNACTECRKKRAKCDGKRPCARCTSQKDVECVYEIPVRQSKENMRSEIEQLRAQQKHSERVLGALVAEKSDHVLELLRTGETLEQISDKLDGGKDQDESHSASSQVGHQGANITTYSQAKDQYMISNALQSARSIGSSDYSALTQGENYGELYQDQRTGSWSGWAGESNASNLANDAKLPDDVMNWSPGGSQVSPHGQRFPLIGTWSQEDQKNPDTRIQMMREEGRNVILGHEFNYNNQAQFNGTWTAVTSDRALVEHLMALYFCWEYPTFASLSKEHFLDDFLRGDSRHCSTLLVNAMLAVGSRFSTKDGTRTDPNESKTAGDEFFEEALRLLMEEQDRHRLTTIQALGLMSIREASAGRCSESIYYASQSVKLAIEMGLHLEMDSGGGDHASIEHAVRSATFWGAFALDQCWSITVGRLPHFSRDLTPVSKPAIVDHVEASPWIPYTDDGDGLSNALWQQQLTGDPGAPLERNCTQPSNVRSVYKCFCELSEIVHQALYLFYTPGVYVTGKSLINVYTKYLRWYDSIPEALRLGRNFTPSVLFAHMYYHYAILLLFRPFIKMEIVGSGISPRDVCNQAAEALSTLLNSYMQLYTLRRTPSFVPYFVLASSITHLVTVGNTRRTPELLHQSLSDLTVMTSCHGFASRCREIVVFLSKHWNIDVSIDDPNLPANEHKTFCRPRSSSFNLFSPNFQKMDIDSGISEPKEDENPLFWPFPMQGRPLLEMELEKAGLKIWREE